MSIEIIVNNLNFKEIYHYTEKGTMKINIGEKGQKKIPLVLVYVNDYMKKNNMKLQSNEAERSFTLVSS